MADIVPYGFSDEAVPLQQTPESDDINGVVIICDQQNLATLIGTMQRWFADFGDVNIVDYGHTDKRGSGYLIIEWIFCEIDRLFLKILDSEEIVEDYTTYVRDGEDE